MNEKSNAREIERMEFEADVREEMRLADLELQEIGTRDAETLRRIDAEQRVIEQQLMAENVFPYRRPVPPWQCDDADAAELEVAEGFLYAEPEYDR